MYIITNTQFNADGHGHPYTKIVATFTGRDEAEARFNELLSINKMSNDPFDTDITMRGPRAFSVYDSWSGTVNAYKLHEYTND